MPPRRWWAPAPLIITHGWDANRHWFDKNIPVLARKHKVISYDLRGHGESDRTDRTEYGLCLDRMAKDLRQLIDILGLKDVALAGWSMGVEITLDYIRQFGCANLSKLCLIDMTTKFLNDDSWNLGIYGHYTLSEALKDLSQIATDWNALCDVFVPLIFSKSGNARKEDLAWAMSQARDNTPHAMMNMWISMCTQDYRDMLGTISVPTLLMYAGDGSLFFPSHGEYMKKSIKDAKLVIFEGCGHTLQIEDPEKFNRELAAFLG